MGGVAVEVGGPNANTASLSSGIRTESRTLTAQILKSFGHGGTGFELNVEFSAAPGITILFGASGAGKTTLLNCLAGLTSPDAGHIALGDSALFDSERGTHLPVAQRGIGYVFQDLALFPHLNAEKNVQYGIAKVSAQERGRRSASMLRGFRVEHVRDRLPKDISGGERQRVALARALVTEPRLLLLDEPLAALDAATKSHIVDDLRQWNEAHHIPILYVTHSREEVFALGERVLMLEHGQIIAQGTPHEVMGAPRQESVAQLLGFENIFETTVIAAHEERGTMTCRLDGSNVELETPLLRAPVGAKLFVGIRAGDILLATERPKGLSARNIFAGRLVSLSRRDVIVAARVDCGVEMEAHLTLAARDALCLSAGQTVWSIVKTHSCHLMTR
jgi:molybdate transport system ATP-binding protein